MKKKMKTAMLALLVLITSSAAVSGSFTYAKYVETCVVHGQIVYSPSADITSVDAGDKVSDDSIVVTTDVITPAATAAVYSVQTDSSDEEPSYRYVEYNTEREFSSDTDDDDYAEQAADDDTFSGREFVIDSDSTYDETNEIYDSYNTDEETEESLPESYEYEQTEAMDEAKY